MARLGWLALLVAAVALAALAPTGAGAVLPQDDAGTDRDAPDEPVPEVSIESGERYRGTLGALDLEDHYAFTADEGDRIVARVSGPLGCLAILGPEGNELNGAHCPVGAMELSRSTVTAPADGTYYLDYYSFEAQEYTFSLGVEEPAPPPRPVDTGVYTARGIVPDVHDANQSGEHTVVAVIDTGINPYHEFLRAPDVTDHPSAWLDGFPEDAETVNLSLEADGYESALAADAETWDELEYSGSADSRGIHGEELYTFPGTRVVAGISFGDYAPFLLGGGGSHPVLDEHGHGTGSAGLAAGTDLDQADGDVLVVAVEVEAATFVDGFWWAARQPWIDAISGSLGTVANLPSPPVVFGQGDAVPFATKHAVENGIPVLISSGNGFTSTGLGPDHCSTHTSAYTGPSWVTRIGAAEPRTGNPSTWHCVPVEAVARTPAPSLEATSMAGTDDHTGTSASTPNVAGHLAHLLLETRQDGIETTPQEALDHLLHAAAPADPEPGLGAEPSLPGPSSVVDQGYGLVDGDAVDRALDTLAAGQGPDPRPAEDAFFAADAKVRDGLWGEDGAFTSPPGSDQATDVGPTNADAGTDRDAPDEPPSDLVVEPDTVYEGAFDGWRDPQDVYAVPLEAGDQVEVAYRGQILCMDVWRPDQSEHALDEAACSYAGRTQSTTFEANETGTWYIGFSYFVANDYSFAYAINGSAPLGLDPGPDAGPTHEDAGTDRDAPDDPPSNLTVDPGTVYGGAIDGWIDRADVYAVSLQEGDELNVRFQGQLLCLDVWRPDLTAHPQGACTYGGPVTYSKTSFEVTETGTWYMGFGSSRLDSFVPNDYSFAFAVDGAAPNPTPSPPGMEG